MQGIEALIFIITHTLTGITGSAVLTPVSYDITMQLTEAGELNLSYDNIFSRSDGRWVRQRQFPLGYRFNRTSDRVNDKILEIANDPVLYGRYERDAMGDIVFLNAIMQNMTDIAFKDFISNYPKDAIVEISGRVVDVSEANTKIDDVEYKYVITLLWEINVNTNTVFISPIGIGCRLYTNDDSVIRLTKTSVVTRRGTIAGIHRTVARISMTFVDAVQ